MKARDLVRFEWYAERWTGGRLQLLVLSRHFFNRFFQNEIIPFEEQMKEKIITVLAVLATLGWFLTNILFSQYLFAPDGGRSWVEKFAFLSIFMIILAFIVVLQWDVIFLDRKDHLNLGPLPIPMRKYFSAKFLAFALFVAAYTAAVNFFSCFFIGFFLPQWISSSVSSLAIYMVAHIAATTAAFAFVFVLFVFIEAVLIFLLGPRLFRAFTMALRFLLFVAATAIVLVAVLDPYSLKAVLDRMMVMRAARPAALLVYPPMWFTAIYEILIGRSNPFYVRAAGIGLAATAGLGLAAFGALAFSYKSHIHKSLEVRLPRLLFGRVRAALTSLFDRVFLRNPAERAVFHFTSRTLRNSPAHKIQMSAYLAVGVAISFLLIGTHRVPAFDPSGASLNLFGVPIILGLALVLGIRNAVNRPFAVEANWVFRIAESRRKAPYFLGLKKAVIALLLAPLAVVLFAAFAWLWGPGPAAVHVLFGSAWILLAMELFFWKYSRFPFACAVVPGRAKLYARWLPYVLGLWGTATIIALMERILFRKPAYFGLFFGLAALVLFVLEFIQRRSVYETLTLVYEESPDPVMITL